jgi:hypothetical protein
VTFDEAVALIERVAGARSTSVTEGTFGPLIDVTFAPGPQVSANVLSEGGVLVTRLDVAGGGLFFGRDMFDDSALAQKVDELLAWQSGARDQELEALGAITDPAPRVAQPKPFSIRGTVMSAPEAMLSALPDVQEVYDVLGAPFAATNTPECPFEDVWVLVVGLK